jgi:hypothetical protein
MYTNFIKIIKITNFIKIIHTKFQMYADVQKFHQDQIVIAYSCGSLLCRPRCLSLVLRLPRPWQLTQRYR